LRHTCSLATRVSPVGEVVGDELPGVEEPVVQERPVRVLVVGYGCSLRCDDAVGQRVAEELRRRSRGVPVLSGAKFVVTECLTPELAEDLAGSGFAILADAALDGRPGGTVTVAPVTGAPPAGTPPAGAPPAGAPPAGAPPAGAPPAGAKGGGGAGVGGGRAAAGCWEDLSPMTLLALARDLYGNAPEAVVVSVGVEETSVGEGLSAAVEAAVPEAAALAEEAARTWAANSGQSAVRSGTGGTSPMR
jgi:Ni,Fe-hydrogenase maturation factor